MRTLADNGAYVLGETGGQLLFFRRPILPSWLAFVPGVVAVVAVGNGVVNLVVGGVALGVVLLALGCASAFGVRAVRRSRRRARAAPLDPAAALLVVDLGARTLLDGVGRFLAPLDVVRFERAMQATSSARALRAVWPGGTVVVFRGDPLQTGGSIDDAVKALHARGVPV